jgi:HAMP domain-containing protein
MVKEKLALEVALAEKEDKIGDMQREIDKQPNEDVQLELREKLELIERQRKEEIGLLEEKLRELEEEVERLLQEK